MNPLHRSLSRICLFTLAVLAFAARPAFCEDPFQLKLKNPTRYKNEFTNAHNEAISDALEIEMTNDGKIKFHVVTSDDYDRVCELSGVARANKKDMNDFVFTYGPWKKCRLHFKMSPDRQSIVTTDFYGNCARHFCNGFVDGITFKKVR